MKEGWQGKFIGKVDLAAECWLIQTWGKNACKTCNRFEKPECNGKNILKTGMNKNGVIVGEQGVAYEL